MVLLIISSAASALESRDIGTTGTAGSMSISGTRITIKGSGGDIAGASDGFRFAYERLSGDGQITARLTSVSETDSWTKFGLMIRKDLTAGAANFMFLTLPKLGSTQQYRTAAGGNTVSQWTSSSSKDISDYPDRDIRYHRPGTWFRLAKVGTKVSAYTSLDGKCWIPRRSITLSGLSGATYFGVALTSHNFGVLATGIVDNLQISSVVDPVNANCPRAEVDGPPAADMDYQNLEVSGTVDSRYDLLANFFVDYIKSHKIPGGQLAIMRDFNSFDSCSEDLLGNYGTPGEMVVSTAVGWRNKKQIDSLSTTHKLRHASVDKVITDAVIAEIYKRRLHDFGYNRLLKVRTATGIQEKSLSQIPFGEIPVLSYLRDYLQESFVAYPGLSFSERAELITIDHLMQHKGYVQEWQPTTAQEDKDAVNGISFTYDQKKFYMLEKAAFDYGVSLAQWEPKHLARWIFSQPVAENPGIGEGSYSSNGKFLLRYLSDTILRRRSSSLLTFLKQDMGMPGMIITNELPQNRDPEEAGYFVEETPDKFLFSEPFLDDYYALGSSAEQLARYFEKYMLSYKWDTAKNKFIVNSGGAPGQSPGAFTTVKHNKCQNNNLEKYSIATLTNKGGAYDQAPGHIGRALYDYPKCSQGSFYARAWQYNTPSLLRSHNNLVSYLGHEGNRVAALYNPSKVESKWTFTSVDGEYVRISSNGLFLHAEYTDGSGTPIVQLAPYSATNSSGTGLGSWWTAMWKLEPVGNGKSYRIRNRSRSTLYLGARKAGVEDYDGYGQIQLKPVSQLDAAFTWSVCPQ
ncbi:MAG: RICIN domain-containing protein [Cellvibrionaceae bacterium]|nr:RICIN domain-containing protein [Cellvibrionaceae bacterium]